MIGEWFKIIHILAVISWMAGLLYLPRLFVYHAGSVVGSEQSETFKIMEYKLYGYIMNPAMMASWTFGLLSAYYYNYFISGWFHVKLLLVIILTACHYYLYYCLKQFREDRNIKPARFFRYLNEIPTILMIFIVILVVSKPF